MTTLSDNDLLARLHKVTEGLKFNRETHVAWRDWLLKSPDNETINPHAGNAQFHDDTIKEYDEHLATVSEAVDELLRLRELLDAGEKVGAWLAAALDDPDACVEMKQDIERFLRVLPAAQAEHPDPYAERLKADIAADTTLAAEAPPERGHPHGCPCVVCNPEQFP